MLTKSMWFLLLVCWYFQMLTMLCYSIIIMLTTCNGIFSSDVDLYYVVSLKCWSILCCFFQMIYLWVHRLTNIMLILFVQMLVNIMLILSDVGQYYVVVFRCLSLICSFFQMLVQIMFILSEVGQFYVDFFRCWSLLC